jgi:hypothetical protein
MWSLRFVQSVNLLIGTNQGKVAKASPKDSNGVLLKMGKNLTVAMSFIRMADNKSNG